MKIELKGNTSQDGTPTPEAPAQVQTVTGNNIIKVVGKNLFDISQFPLSKNKAYANGQPVNWTGYYRIDNYLEVSGNETYTFSNSLGLPMYYGLVQYDENKEIVTSTNARTTTFTTESNTKYIRFGFQSSEEPTWIQLETGDSATENESYQSQTYPIYLGGNAFNINDIEENKYIGYSTGDIGDSSVTNLSNYIYVIENKNYTLSFEYTTLLNTNNRGLCFYDENKNYVSGRYMYVANKTQTIAIPSGVKYVRFAYDKNMTDIKFVADIPQIELCKINNYQDKIYKDNGKWYLYKETGKVILDGSEIWNIATNFWTPSIEDYAYRDNIPYSNYFKGVINQQAVTSLTEDNTFAFKNRSGEPRLYIKSSSFTTTTEFENWLSTHNTIIYYALENPTTEEITDTRLISQLEALLGVSSYQGQTNINQENSNLASPLDATTLQEM